MQYKERLTNSQYNYIFKQDIHEEYTKPVHFQKSGNECTKNTLSIIFMVFPTLYIESNFLVFFILNINLCDIVYSRIL